MANPFLRNNTTLLVASANVVGLSLQINFPWRGDTGNALRPLDLRAIAWPGGKRIDLRWTNPGDVTRVLIKRSTSSHPVFPGEGELVYHGGPIEHFIDGEAVLETVGAEARIQRPSERDADVPRTGVPLEENTIYYYTVFLTRATGPVGLLDFGPVALPGAHVTGLSIIDYFHKPMGQFHGDWLYRRFSEATIERDQEDARTKGRSVGFFEGFCRFVQAGIDLQRGMIRALEKLTDASAMPAGLIGKAADVTSILAAQAAIYGIDPDSRLFDTGVLRRLADSMIALSKEKGSLHGLVNFVRVLTLWEASAEEYGGASFCNDVFLRTWDGRSSVTVRSYQASTLYIEPGQISFPGAPFELDEFLGGMILGPMGDTYVIASNNEDVIELEDTEAVLRIEDGVEVLSVDAETGVEDEFFVTVARVEGGPEALRPNEYSGYHLLDADNQYYRILPLSNVTTPNVLRVRIVNGLAPVTGYAVVAPSYSRSSNIDLAAGFAQRNARVAVTLSQGCFRTLWHPGSDTAQGVLFDGGFSTGVPFREGDVILTIQPGAAAVVGNSVEIMAMTLIDETAPFGTEGSLVNFLVNPNQNQTTLFRIVANTSTTLWIESFIEGVDLTDVAVDGNTYAVFDPVQARRYELLQKLIHTMSATRTFIHFT